MRSLCKHFFIFFAVVALAVADEAASSENKDEAVIALTTADFDQFIADNELVLVEFYAPWCGHCKKLAPEYEKAAQELKETKKIPLVKVDATKEETLAKKYEVSGFPTLKFFRNGKAEEYKGGRTASTIVEWVSAMSGPPVEVVANKEAADAIVAKTSVTFVGMFTSKDASQYSVFEAVADVSRNLGKFIAVFDSKNKNEMTVHRKEEGLIATVPVGEKDALIKLCKEERFPYFGQIDADNYADYSEGGLDLVWFAGSPDNFKKNADVIREVAKEFRSTNSFVWLDTEKFKDHAEGSLGVKEFPSLVLQKKDGRYLYPARKFGKAAKVAKWMKDVASGLIEKYLMSEEIPDVNDDPVKVVVGKSFKEMVVQKDKDVLLEVYAPWCGHCKKFEPIYLDFATKNLGNSKLVVAKMDGTTNEPPLSKFEWKGFPTVFFVKAGTEEPILYQGDRSYDDLANFVNQHLSWPAELKEEAKEEL